MNHCHCGWMLTAMLLCAVLASLAQQPPPRPQAPQVKEIALPPAETPALSWVRAPTGPGEFLFNEPGPQQGLQVGDRRILATSLGLLCIQADGSTSLLPALYAQPTYLAGQFDGKLWVQNTKGGLFALDLQSLKVVEEYPEVKGQCLAVTPGGFWCLDTFELAQGFGTRGGNSLPAAYGLIFYDRQGKEARRLQADGTAFPKSEIHWATLDGDAIWVIAHTCLGVICGCGARDYAAGHLYRVDCAAGTVQMVKSALIPAVPFILKDRLIWILPNERQEFGNAEVMQLDKRTLAVTRLGVIPGKFAERLQVDERYLWCYPRDYAAESTAAPEPVVYRLQDCRRVRLAEAGPAPLAVKSFDPVMRLGRARGEAYFRLLAAGDHCAWLQKSTDSNLFEIADDGRTLVRDLSAISMPARDPEEIGGFLMPLKSLPDSLLFHSGGQYHQVYLLKAEAPTLMKISFPESVNNAIASDRRLWLSGSGGKVFTAGVDLRFTTITLPQNSESGWRASVAIGDAVFKFRPDGPLKIDAATGKTVPVASWKAQLSDEVRAELDTPYRSYRARDGRLVYLFSIEKDNDKWQTAVVSYQPTEDRWQYRLLADSRHMISVITRSESYLIPYEDTSIFRGEGDEDTLAPAGELPFMAYRASATEQYLYLNTDVGVYRARWAELLRDRRN